MSDLSLANQLLDYMALCSNPWLSISSHLGRDHSMPFLLHWAPPHTPLGRLFAPHSCLMEDRSSSSWCKYPISFLSQATQCRNRLSVFLWRDRRYAWRGVAADRRYRHRSHLAAGSQKDCKAIFRIVVCMILREMALRMGLGRSSCWPLRRSWVESRQRSRNRLGHAIAVVDVTDADIFEQTLACNDRTASFDLNSLHRRVKMQFASTAMWWCHDKTRFHVSHHAQQQPPLRGISWIACWI